MKNYLEKESEGIDMGIGGISIWQILIILIVILLLFGGRNRIKNLGADLGEALKGFKKSVIDDEEKK